ncbi:MAG: toprim domain-containing protein [Rhodoferax sp.]|nr:MAG: toprim domain-containing protein [Rhodoferax sp.]
MASNYDDVLSQLQAAGLQVDSLEIGRMRRCKVEGDREKRGWYHLHELRLQNGHDVIVGSFGVWRGAENNATKVELRKTELSQEQAAALRKRLAEDKKRSEAARKADAARAAEKAAAAWRKCAEQGGSEYLTRKGVGAHGVRFSPQGAMVIPMLDVAGRIHGLQIIRGKQPGQQRKLDKEFWPSGLIKKHHFHLLGMVGMVTPIILVAEGYATAASLYEATGLPVAVAFDAGNLGPVATELHGRYKKARILICADDDAFSDGNPGVTCASAAALEVGGAYVAPRFADEEARRAAYESKGQKITDFNDLHLAEGLHVVRVQIEARITELGWRVQAARAATKPQGEGVEKDPLKPIESVDELLERYALVYGQGGSVFDHQEHMLLALSDMRDACLRREVHRAWCEHPDKQIVRVQEVGFDPAGTDPEVKCNLWAGWPTTPKAGKCEYLLDLLRYMCAGETKSEDLYNWVLKWIAYPIQHPGAKMKTTLVIHGPQGTGKNMFFEALMAIYGRYGRVIDQSAIEDKFNDWASGKLFLIADEVVARSDLYHVKNKLKAFITGEWIRINPKNRTAYDERNHVNMVFLSNEAMPVVLEEDDRRHAVIWTPEKLSPDFYQGLMAEVAAGGVAALHDYLLHLPMDDFTNGTLPPMTEAKRELIHLGLDSPSRFVIAFERGDVDGFPGLKAPALLTPCLSQDFYDLYGEWCKRQKLTALNQPRFMNAVKRKHKGWTDRKRVGHSTNPATVLQLPGGNELPPGQSESDWLEGRVQAFKAALKIFRQQTMGGGSSYD